MNVEAINTLCSALSRYEEAKKRIDKAKCKEAVRCGQAKRKEKNLAQQIWNHVLFKVCR